MDCYAARVADGVYTDIYDQLQSISTRTLANATYRKDFVRESTTRGNYKFVSTEDYKEFTSIIFGEICHSFHGTNISAKGNHFPGPNANPITDKSQIKDVLVLGKPALAHDDLATLFDDQIATLNEIRIADEEEEKLFDNKPYVKEWVTSTSSEPVTPNNLIVVNLHPKYAIPPQTKVEKPRITKKRARTNTSNNNTSVNENQSIQDGTNPESYKIALGNYYPPNLLPDHRGPYFQHNKSMLVQLDIQDINKQLIAPWNMYDKLRPGTLVLATIKLVVWVIKATHEGANDKKIYHIIADKIRVLAESDEPMESPVAPSLPTPTVQPTASSSTQQTDNTSTADAFAAFESPSKKMKLEHN